MSEHETPPLHAVLPVVSPDEVRYNERGEVSETGEGETWDELQARFKAEYDELGFLFPDPPPMKNKYGVEGEMDDGQFIPLLCHGCDHFDGGEFGDYGTRYSWPNCNLGLFFPVRKGTCKKYEPHGTFHETMKKKWEEADARKAAEAAGPVSGGA